MPAVLLDVDGTLVDSNYFHTVAWWRALRAKGHVVPMARIHRLVGMGADTFLEELLGKPDDVEVLRRTLGADEWIDGAVNSSEVEASKPAPDIFGRALEVAGATPDEAVVVGDTVWDVKAAAACGITCVTVTCGGISGAELQEAGAA